MSSGLSPGLLVARRFRLDYLLGEGRTCWVWAATNVEVEKQVALKILKRPARCSSDRYRRFIEGAKATVEHPNVVRIYDLVYLNSSQPCIVMELLHGSTLRDKLANKGRLSLRQSCTALCQVVSALGKAHAHGVVHCDLKPENIFLQVAARGTTTVKVLDFGIAKRGVTRGTAGHTQIGDPPWRVSSRRGTLGYAAPEQDAGGHIDHRADIWAAGIVLYECLTGERPFPTNDWDEYLQSCRSRERHDPRSLVPEIPAEIAQLIGRMLSHDQSLRPDLHEVIAALEAYSDIEALPFEPPFSMLPEAEHAAAMSTVSEPESYRFMQRWVSSVWRIAVPSFITAVTALALGAVYIAISFHKQDIPASKEIRSNSATLEIIIRVNDNNILRGTSIRFEVCLNKTKCSDVTASVENFRISRCSANEAGTIPEDCDPIANNVIKIIKRIKSIEKPADLHEVTARITAAPTPFVARPPPVDFTFEPTASDRKDYKRTVEFNF